MLVAGHALPAGTYSIWMIPDPDAWTIILHEAWQVYHTPYPEGREVLRFTRPPDTGQYTETLSFHFPRVDGPEATLAFQWGTTLVEIPISIEQDH